MKQRIALVHDNLLEFGGSERVLAELLLLYPTADCYTFFLNRHNAQVDAAFGNKRWHCAWVQHIPYLERLAQYFAILKPLAWWHFSHLDLQGYDLVITSSHSYNSKCVHVAPSTKHVCYLHTPPRFLYGLKHEMERYTNVFLLRPLWTLMRRIDCAAAQRPDLLFVNSKEVQHRVKKYYGRSSTILYPPVRSITVRGKRTARYYVAHGRLVRQKRIDFIVRACRVAQLPLKVIGEGYLKKDLQRKAGPNIEFLGFVTDAQLASIYRNAKALMYAAEDEDFGIVPVEAQSAGVPVLAFRSGGVLETVREGITGYFFSRISQRAVMNTVLRLEQFPLSSHACVVNARQFSAQQFARTFKKHIRLLQKPS